MSIQAVLTKILLRPYFSWLLRQPYQVQREKQENFNRRSAFFPKGTEFEEVDVGDVPAEWIFAPGCDHEKVFLYLHGGAYYTGSIVTHRAFASHLGLATGSRVLLLDYRLAPENPFPAALDDATVAYRWLLSQGVAPARLIIAGDSAGGGLALATLLSLRDLGDPLPSGAICLSPWTDLTLQGNSIAVNSKKDFICNPHMLRRSAKMYCAEHNPMMPLISPLYADLSGLPPIMIHVGDQEILLDDAVRFAERARTAGVDIDLHIWPRMFHVFPIVNYLPEAKQALELMGTFVRR